MKLTLQDLKRTEMYKSLPTSEFNKLGEGEFIVFFYFFDDATSSIIDIKGVKVVPTIHLSLYKNMPTHTSGEAYSFGYFQTPFDTQSSLFYHFLRYYYAKEEGQNRNVLLSFFQEARKKDLESIEYKKQKTLYSNSFKIYSRDNFVNAVDRFLVSTDEIKQPVLSVADSIDSYYKKTQNKSFYGDCVEKVIMAIRNPNGGLIPEEINKLRYLYIGENSLSMNDDKGLGEAKEMFRNGFKVEEIFAKTNWFFNKFDSKWRKPLSDVECTVPTLEKDSMFMKSDSKFYTNRDEVYYCLTKSSLDAVAIEEFVDKGWDIYLSDVLKHSTLYKHYPKLYRMPIFYAVNSKQFGTDNNDYSFYYSPKGYLMIVGNPEILDLRTILLHEVQHAIQQIEGFATGGNTYVAKMIQAIGGENVKAYFFIMDNIERLYSLEATENGKYNYDKYERLFSYLLSSLRTLMVKNAEDYYKMPKASFGSILNAYLNSDTESKTKIKEFFGTDGAEIMDGIKKVEGFINASTQTSARLIGQGFSKSDVKKIFFQTYEALAGEIESRDVQHSSRMEEGLEGYFMPLSSESIEEKKITAMFDAIVGAEKIPSKIKGAVETTTDGKYVIHLFENLSAQPVIHEMGHIVGDLIGRDYVAMKITETFAEQSVESLGGIDEVFCEIFSSYISRQNLSGKFTNDLSKGRDKIGKFEWNSVAHKIFDDKLDEIFLPVEDEAKNNEFMSRIQYLVKLNELIENGELLVEETVIVPEEVIAVEEQIVEETPIEEKPIEPTKTEEKIEEVPVDETPKEDILTYHAFYKGKQIELEAKSMMDARNKAVPLLKANPKKAWEVTVVLVGKNGKELTQSTAF